MRDRKKAIQAEGLKRKIGDSHGYPVLRLPKVLMELGVKLNQEVVIIKEPTENPLFWQIIVKPASSADNELVERACDSKGKKNSHND